MLLTGWTTAVAFFIVSLIWSAGLTLFLWKLYGRYKNLISDTSGKNLANVLEGLIDSDAHQRQKFKDLKEHLSQIENDEKFHIQKTAVVRFNPFSNTGGDQSFSLAILDGYDSGFVITGLHSRERTRFYIKQVKNGKSTYELSKEERDAIAKAKKGK